MEERPDICLYISDQHSFEVQAYAGDPVVRTPNLDRIADCGTAMMNAYTSYPLCVPARMSMLTGQYASRNGATTNFSALDSNRATFVHCLAAAGYETTLCGRMHFVGPDQRHGFEQRIAGDITQVFHNRPAAIAQERGVHDKTPQGGPSCLSIIGGGDSPTLAFSRYVVERAEKYLSGSYDRPQFLCVGTYAPHHPYVAPNDLYEYYYSRVADVSETFSWPLHPALKKERHLRCLEPEVAHAARAAYWGMVEFEDGMIGRVYDAFQNYLERTGHRGIFIYVSDHGDQVGRRGFYGKSTFYDASVHVPMIFAGDGVLQGRRISGPTSLMDIGPTLCDLAGTQHKLPGTDGASIADCLRGGPDDVDRMVVSEVGGDMTFGSFGYGKMCRYLDYKLIHYEGFDYFDEMYDLSEDPHERVNVIASHRETAAKMREYMDSACNEPIEKIEESARRQRESLPVLLDCDFDSYAERFHAPESARHYPQHMVSSQASREQMKKWAAGQA